MGQDGEMSLWVDDGGLVLVCPGYVREDKESSTHRKFPGYLYA